MKHCAKTVGLTQSGSCLKSGTEGSVCASWVVGGSPGGTAAARLGAPGDDWVSRYWVRASGADWPACSADVRTVAPGGFASSGCAVSIFAPFKGLLAP